MHARRAALVVVLVVGPAVPPRALGVRFAEVCAGAVGRASPAGMLCIGTRRAGKFQTGHQSTELLSFLAHTLGITIAAWLDLPA